MVNENVRVCISEQMNATSMTLMWRGRSHTFTRVVNNYLPMGEASWTCDELDGIYVGATAARGRRPRWSAVVRVGNLSDGRAALMLNPTDVIGKADPQGALDELQRRVDLFLSTAAALP